MQNTLGANLMADLEQLQALLEGVPEASNNGSLSDTLQKLENLTTIKDTEPAESIAERLATAVGKNKAWQIAYRDTGILGYALQQLSTTDFEERLAKQCLRIIGNSVADNDANREFVMREFQHIIDCLSLQPLCATVLAVLFNLCNDFEPAKAAAARLRLDTQVSRLLAEDQVPEAALDFTTDLLTWSTEYLTAVQLKDDTSLEVFTNLLKVASTYDPEHRDEYVAILVHYLQDQDFQQKAALPKLLDNLIALMLDFEARLTLEETNLVFQELGVNKDTERAVPENTKVVLLSQLIGTVSAISSTDAFAQNLNIKSPIIKRVETHLRLPWEKASPSTVCACVMLGNLAMSDEVCIDMVQTTNLHVALISILQHGPETQFALLYTATGFMRHLAFPEANRTILAEAGLIQACSRLLTLDDSSIRGEAAALLCKLVTNNIHNITKVVYDKFELQVRPEKSQEPSSITILSHIIQEALAPFKPLPSTTMKNPMVELGRSIVAMLRYLGRPDAGKDAHAVRHTILETSKIARPVARLMRQRFYAAARSEGLLGLGLMAQFPEGAALVMEEIKEDRGLLDAIKDFADEKDGGNEQTGSTGGRDYQNAMVLLQALQNNAGSVIDASLKDQIVALQDELGKLMV